MTHRSLEIINFLTSSRFPSKSFRIPHETARHRSAVAKLAIKHWIQTYNMQTRCTRLDVPWLLFSSWFQLDFSIGGCQIISSKQMSNGNLWGQKHYPPIERVSGAQDICLHSRDIRLSRTEVTDLGQRIYKHSLVTFVIVMKPLSLLFTLGIYLSCFTYGKCKILKMFETSLSYEASCGLVFGCVSALSLT